MIKYLKWILLIILLISLSIFGIRVINYINSDNNNGEQTIVENNDITDGIDEFLISDIYGFNWRKFGIAIYENNTLFSENNGLDGPYNMRFNEDKVTFCNNVTNECDEYSYSYSDGKITINSGDYFVSKGTYDIKLKDDILELRILDDDLTIVLYFNYLFG